MILALVFALAIGFSLTLLGSGGSIITLPVLVYAARVPPTGGRHVPRGRRRDEPRGNIHERA